LVFSSKLFANMRLNFAGNLMPLLPTMLLQAAAGGGAEVAAQDVPYPVPAPDQSTPQLTIPSRPHSPDPVAPVLEHDHSSAQPETAAGSFPSTEDAHMGADFHTSPARSSHTPPADHPSGVGKLVKKVKSLEVKLKTKKRKMVVSDSDEEDGTTPNVNLEALRALANAAVADDSDAATDVPAATSTTPGVALSASHVAPGASGVAPGASGVTPGGSVTPTAASAVSADSPQVPPGASNKGKSPMIEEDIPVPARTCRKMEEDRLGEEAARRIHEEEMAEIERERAEAQRKRQQEVLESAKFYNVDNWLTIQAQVEANASLSKTLLGDDVSEDNFPARMAALIKKKRQALAEQLFKERQNRLLTLAQQKAYMRQYVKNQSSAIYNTGWSMAYVKSFSDEQLLQEFKKIRKVQTQGKLQSFSRTFKRQGSVLEEPHTKKLKSPEAPTPSMPEITIPSAVTSPLSSRTWRKSVARKHVHKPKPKLPTLDLDAPAQVFLKVIVDEDSEDVDSVDEVWSVVVGWELISTPLGEVNALYRIDGTTRHFTTLRQILHLVDCQDLMRLYGLVVQYYEHHPAVGSDVTYPLSVELMKKMLMKKLEIDSDFIGNDLTTAEQLIQFIKNQIVAAQASSV
nr:hypothetical protein [Tanacetum cinerariifolium]